MRVIAGELDWLDRQGRLIGLARLARLAVAYLLTRIGKLCDVKGPGYCFQS